MSLLPSGRRACAENGRRGRERAETIARGQQGCQSVTHHLRAETSSCAIVVRTPYARLFGGAPNVYVGVAWNVALLGLAAAWLVSGHLTVPWPYLLVAGASVLVGLYLVWALLADLRQPCPL